MEPACPRCGAELETPLACGECGALVSAADDLSPFAILGIPLSMNVDEIAAKKRLRRFTRLVHPDFFATAGTEEVALAETNNAKLNAAYDIVADPVRRADFLVSHLGGPSSKELEAMPQEFLMEVMEWNETLEDALPGSTELRTLERELENERERILDSLRDALSPPSTSIDRDTLETQRKSLNALRYIDRALTRIADAQVS